MLKAFSSGDWSTGKDVKNGYLRYAELIRKLIELGISPCALAGE